MNQPVSLIKVLYSFAFISGVILLMFVIGLYRYTIMNAAIPAIIMLVTGLVSFFINKSHYQRTYNTPGWFFPLFQNIFSWGALACFLFVAANYYLGSGPLKNYKFPIKKRDFIVSRHDRSKTPTVIIDYFGTEKEFSTGGIRKDSVQNANSVQVSSKKGLFGFDVITSWRLVP